MDDLIIIRTDGGFCSQIAFAALGQAFINRGFKVKFDINWFNTQATNINFTGVFGEQKSMSCIYEIPRNFPKLHYEIATEQEILHYHQNYNKATCFAGYDALSHTPPAYFCFYPDTSLAILENKKFFATHFMPPFSAEDAEFAALCEKIKKQKSCGVHVRLGDMSGANADYARIFGTPMGVEYFLNAMNLVLKIESSVHFYLFSDEPEWLFKVLAPAISTKKEFKDRFTIISANPIEKGYLDLYALSCCKHIIGSQGSLGIFGHLLCRREDGAGLLVAGKSQKITEQIENAIFLDRQEPQITEAFGYDFDSLVENTTQMLKANAANAHRQNGGGGGESSALHKQKHRIAADSIKNKSTKNSNSAKSAQSGEHKPMISLLCPFKNDENTIGKFIESALNQTKKDFEIILYNRASSDFSLKIANKFKDARIKILNSEFDFGLTFGLKECLKVARGEFCIFLEASEILESNAIFLAENALKNEDFIESSTNLDSIKSQKATKKPHFALFTQPNLADIYGYDIGRFNIDSSKMDTANIIQASFFDEFAISFSSFCAPTSLYRSLDLCGALCANVREFLCISFLLKANVIFVQEPFLRMRVKIENGVAAKKYPNLEKLEILEIMNCFYNGDLEQILEIFAPNLAQLGFNVKQIKEKLQNYQKSPKSADLQEICKAQILGFLALFSKNDFKKIWGYNQILKAQNTAPKELLEIFGEDFGKFLNKINC